jgi:hypothetical protein
MRTRLLQRPRGYISYVVVLSFGLLITLLMTYAYKSALRAQDVQKVQQIRADIISKEDAVLRSLVAIVPNRAIRCMQSGSEGSAAVKTSLQWGSIFSDAIDQANARNSISPEVAASLGLGTTYKGNTGDSEISDVDVVVTPVAADSGYTVSGMSSSTKRYVASGLNHNLGAGYPVPLNTTDTGAGTSSNISTQLGDILYPIISTEKKYGALAAGRSEIGASVTDYPQFNKIRYPRINFGYAQPGEWFVAKRNWWAFTLNFYKNDFGAVAPQGRDYVLSIYEVPSQLSISTSAFTALGKYSGAGGQAWQNVNIQGRVFTGKAQVEGSVVLDGLASRRSMTLSPNAVIGGKQFGGTSPFTPGLREAFELSSNTTAEFYPVSLPSESGRAVFVPINRGLDFFDRFALSAEAATISKTTWNNYSIGALQCAMKLDVTNVMASNNQTPTSLRFTYKKNGADAVTTIGYVALSAVPPSATLPFGVEILDGNRPCVVIKPELLPAYLATLGADGPSVNHSIAINVDYTASNVVRKPAFPCLSSDTAVIMTDCADLTKFTKGFSLVTNMRLYLGSDFNTVETTKQVATSIYAPERRYGTNMDPLKVDISGQVGSLASDSNATPSRPLDVRMASGDLMAADKIKVNLTPITDPGNLPPITLMNWLIIVEERRKEFY